jgi:hypothetical protein
MQKVQLINQTFEVQLSEKKRSSSVKWASLNLCFLSFIFYDILTTTKFYRESLTFYYIEVVACCILLLSFLTNVSTYIYHSWFSDKIVCENETQRILLNLSNNSVVRTPKAKVPTPAGKQNETINIRNLSYQAYSERTLLKLNSITVPDRVLCCLLANSSMTSLHNSWMNTSGQMRDGTFSANPENSFIELNCFQTPPKFKNNEFISNRSAMDQYLKDVSQQEKDITSAIEAQNNMTGYMGTNFNSFWGNCRFDEIIASLKTSFYQTSPHNNKQSTRDETFSLNDQENNSEIIRNICANKLSNYTANLKMVSA